MFAPIAINNGIGIRTAVVSFSQTKAYASRPDAPLFLSEEYPDDIALVQTKIAALVPLLESNKVETVISAQTQHRFLSAYMRDRNYGRLKRGYIKKRAMFGDIVSTWKIARAGFHAGGAT